MRHSRNRTNIPGGPVPRVVAGGVGLIFAGIGITVLAFLWASPWNEFGSPPLFFRVFGSFIAAAFVLIGGGQCAMMIFGNTPQMLPRVEPSEHELSDASDSMSTRQAAQTPGNYTCPSCGAPLGRGADVSPHGDAKCGYCNRWFNVHSRST
jgi:hypothetical protein